MHGEEYRRIRPLLLPLTFLALALDSVACTYRTLARHGGLQCIGLRDEPPARLVGGLTFENLQLRGYSVGRA